jgi:hypothetical protein
MSGADQQAFLGSESGSTSLLSELPSLLDVAWLDASRYIASSYGGSNYSLVLGTIGNPAMCCSLNQFHRMDSSSISV